jgi:CHAT domain-containing protein
VNNLAWLYSADKRPNEAFQLLERGQHAETYLLLARLRISSPQQALALIRQVENVFHAVVSLVQSEFMNSEEHVRRAADLVLRRKALVIEMLRSQRNALLSGRYPDLAPQFRDAASLRMQVVVKTLAGPAEDESPKLHWETLDKWKTRLDKLERQLAREIPELEIEEQLRAADSRTVALALPEGATLIEFLRFDVFNPTGHENDRWKPAHYAAFIISAGQSDPVRMVDLGEAATIDTIVSQFRRSVAGAGVQSTQQLGEQLRAILNPVLPPGSARLYLATDGELGLLPFEALPAGPGRFLIDQYQISYLGSGRDLLQQQKGSTVEAAGALVLADPEFDLVTTNSPTAGLWSSLGRELDREGIRFNPLPGTRVEGERIGQLLRVDPWFAGRVLEKLVKRQCSPRLLHIATHGFFLEDPESFLIVDRFQREETAYPPLRKKASEASPLQGPGMGNPMLRSGLALAGSQSWLERKPLPGT